MNSRGSYAKKPNRFSSRDSDTASVMSDTESVASSVTSTASRGDAIAGTKAEIKKVYDRYDRGELNGEQFVREVEDVGVPITGDFERLVQKQASDRCGFNNVVRTLNLNNKNVGAFESDVKPNTVVYTKKNRIDHSAQDAALEEKVARKMNIDMSGQKKIQAQQARTDKISSAIKDYSSGNLNSEEFRNRLRANNITENQEITKLIQKKEYGDYVGHKEIGHVVMQQFKTAAPTPDTLLQGKNINSLHGGESPTKFSSRKQDALIKEEELRTNGVYVPRKKKPGKNIITADQTNGNILAWDCKERKEIGGEKTESAKTVKSDKLSHSDFISWSGNASDSTGRANAKGNNNSKRGDEGGDIIGWRFGDDNGSGSSRKKVLNNNFNESNGLW